MIPLAACIWSSLFQNLDKHTQCSHIWITVHWAPTCIFKIFYLRNIFGWLHLYESYSSQIRFVWRLIERKKANYGKPWYTCTCSSETWYGLIDLVFEGYQIILNVSYEICFATFCKPEATCLHNNFRYNGNAAVVIDHYFRSLHLLCVVRCIVQLLLSVLVGTRKKRLDNQGYLRVHVLPYQYALMQGLKGSVMDSWGVWIIKACRVRIALCIEIR